MTSFARIAVGLFFLVLASCGGDDDSGRTPTPTAPPAATETATSAVETATPTATAVEPTATPTPPPTATATATATATPTATATATMPPTPRAIAKEVEDASELIGGPLAVGRVGDYLLANDKIRVLLRAPGRAFSFLLTYGGNIVDADIVREPGEPGRDNFGGMTPLINVSSTVNVQHIEILNDGANGEPAVIRTTGVDDLLDAIDPANAIASISDGIVSIPPSAIDNDIPVQIMTDYTLAAGSNSIRIETTILNQGDEPLALYVGDYINGSGEVDTFVPSFGFGEVILRPTLPYLAYTGVYDATGVTYGVVPIAPPDATIPASGFGQSGFFAYLLGQDVFQVLLTGQPGILAIPPGETGSFVRYFVVTDGDVGSIADARHELLAIPTGTVAGTVTVAGEPAAGALVSVVQKPGTNGAPFNVVDSFRTAADGHFSGGIEPGDYSVLVKLPGYPYDSGTMAPTEHPVTVEQGATAEVDVDLPATGRLVVTVEDEIGQPMPAKVSLVGFDQAPDPGNHTSFVIVPIDGFVFTSDIKQKGADLFGLAGVHFTDTSGSTGELLVPPAEYQVVVTRGPEYSDYQERITINAGETTSVDALIARVVDTTGFVSADHHVHLINSLDSSVTRDERLMTMAAEGVEYFIATDHDYITDLSSDLERLGLGEFLSTGIGEEITTFNYGHFNAYPLSREADEVAGGAIDWGRAGVPPGMDYPSFGSYDLSPAELFETAKSRLELGPDNGVVQVNHINSSTLGFFQITGVDTALDPPQSSVDPALIRQDPSLTNLYDDAYTALELWIEAGRDQTQLLLDANLGDWFNLLNQGRIKSAIADSDTHHTAIIQAGGPRTYVASSTDLPSEIDPGEHALNINEGKLIATNGPFVDFRLLGDGDAVAGLGVGESNLVTATSGNAILEVHVRSPEWAEYDTIEVYANTVPVPVEDEGPHGITVPRYSVAPAMVLTAGTDFTVNTRRTMGLPATSLFTNVNIPISVDRDTWVVVLVKGTDGVSRPLWPMNPQDLDQESNQTLDDLTDGNLGEGGNPALAFTNPLFIDFDGNGQFDASGQLP